jgi:hypothetical protein
MILKILALLVICGGLYLRFFYGIHRRGSGGQALYSVLIRPLMIASLFAHNHLGTANQTMQEGLEILGWLFISVVVLTFVGKAAYQSFFVSRFGDFLAPVWVAIGNIGFFNKESAGGLNDVYESAAQLKVMATPYQVSEKEFTTPIFVGRVGVGKKAQPLHLPHELFDANHISVLGGSGTGKSKLTAWILAQRVYAGTAVVVVDPKGDNFMQLIMQEAAKQASEKFIFVDLNADVPQLNPFKGASREEKEEILETALQIDPSGNPSVDFHRGEDRDACASLIATGKSNIVDLLEAGSTLKDVTSRTNFWRELRSLGRIIAFHTDAGPDLAEEIEAGSVIYIVGSTDNLRVMAAQKMLLARLFQIVKKREQSPARRQVTMFLDETKYLLSNPVMRALGTIRSKGCNLILAYQDEGDLSDCKPLEPKAVLGAINGNSTIQFVYKLGDVKTAEAFSKKAGDKRVFIESTNKLLQDGLQAGSWREGQDSAVTVDMLTTSLPKPMNGEASVCFVYGLGPAFPLSTMHMPAYGEPPTVTPARAMKPLTAAAFSAQSAI